MHNLVYTIHPCFTQLTSALLNKFLLNIFGDVTILHNATIMWLHYHGIVDIILTKLMINTHKDKTLVEKKKKIFGRELLIFYFFYFCLLIYLNTSK